MMRCCEQAYIFDICSHYLCLSWDSFFTQLAAMEALELRTALSIYTMLSVSMRKYPIKCKQFMVKHWQPCSLGWMWKNTWYWHKVAWILYFLLNETITLTFRATLYNKSYSVLLLCNITQCSDLLWGQQLLIDGLSYIHEDVLLLNMFFYLSRAHEQ